MLQPFNKLGRLPPATVAFRLFLVIASYGMLDPLLAPFRYHVGPSLPPWQNQLTRLYDLHGTVILKLCMLWYILHFICIILHAVQAAQTYLSRRTDQLGDKDD